VIECYPNGVARESHTPRTASQLELYPRDVVLFAPISRLAAPQRATIAVRCASHACMMHAWLVDW